MKRGKVAFARRWLPILLLLFLIVVGGAAGSRRTEAHAFLQSSDPAANSVLADTPVRISMRFTEPIEHTATSKAVLYDQNGAIVPGTKVAFDPSDKFIMNLAMPDKLPNGTYSVVWQTLSAADGHEAQGYISFTIGTVNDIASVVPPALSTTSGPSLWVQATARWISYIGLAMIAGIWPVWLLVLRPAISPAWQAGPRLTRRVRKLTYLGVGIGLLGAVLALYVQIDAAAGSERLVSAARSTLTDTRYGRIWLARCVLFLLAGFAYLSAAWWWPRRQRAVTVATLGLCAALPIPFSLVSHASAQTDGRATAIAADAVHLLAVSVWIGGLIALVFGLLVTLRDLTAAGRRVVLARAIPRFSAVALTCWGAIAITGLYAGWLQVGSLKGLRDTAYGTTLTVKLLLLVPLLGLAAFNLLFVSRHIKRSSESDQTGRWTRRFGIAIVAEVVLALAVLLAAGRLTAQPPARETLAQNANLVRASFALQDRSGILTLDPGKTGPNHYRLEIGGAPLPSDTTALLRLTVPNINTSQNEITLERVGGNAWEWHGSELSIVGTWNIEVIVREIGSFNDTATFPVQIRSSTGGSNLPRDAWRFSTGGVIGLLMLVFGVAAIAFGWWSGRGTVRKEGFGLGAVALALGALLLVQARVTSATSGIDLTTQNPVVADDASIQRGSAAFQANCTLCHGVAGKGDGPLANTFDPPAANFLTAHAKLHLDAEFFNWIKYGKPGTSMPSFGDKLTDDQIWDVINYLRYIQKQSDLAASPVASPATGAGPAASPIATPVVMPATPTP
jgi:copper transport protein